MIETENLTPWYRQFWPWFLIAFPLSAVLAGVATYWLAARSADGLVEDDYYKQGLAINRTLDRDHVAQRAILAAQLRTTPQGVAVTLSGQLTRMPDRLVLRVLHPTRSGMDQTVVLVRAPSGEYRGGWALPGAGKWHLLLQDEGGVWRLLGEWSGAETSVPLRPARVE